MPPQNVPEVIHALQQNPRVLGLIEFGTDHADNSYALGDYDVFAVLTDHFDMVTSLHFYAGDIPVDLNFITYAELERLTARDYFRWVALHHGRIKAARHFALERLQRIG